MGPIKQRRKEQQEGGGYVVEQVMTHEAKGEKKQPWMTPKKKKNKIYK
jgi:hypothetical protein